MTKLSKEGVTILSDLMVAGKVTPVIDRCYDLSEVPEAIRYFEEGHARGKGVITFEHQQHSLTARHRITDCGNRDDCRRQATSEKVLEKRLIILRSCANVFDIHGR